MVCQKERHVEVNLHHVSGHEHSNIVKTSRGGLTYSPWCYSRGKNGRRGVKTEIQVARAVIGDRKNVSRRGDNQ